MKFIHDVKVEVLTTGFDKDCNYTEAQISLEVSYEDYKCKSEILKNVEKKIVKYIQFSQSIYEARNKDFYVSIYMDNVEHSQVYPRIQYGEYKYSTCPVNGMYTCHSYTEVEGCTEKKMINRVAKKVVEVMKQTFEDNKKLEE